jgi:hypothetical protein
MKPYIECFKCGKPSYGWTYCKECNPRPWDNKK